MLKKPGDPTGANPEEDPATVAARAQRAETLLWLRGQAANASYIPDTLAERYLVEHRGLAGSPPWPPALRFKRDYQTAPDRSPHPCLLALVTNTAGDLVALHSSELDPLTAAKSTRTDTPKRSRGPVHEGAVFLGDPNDTPAVLAIAEGVETALTRRLVGPVDLYACVGPLRFIPPRPYHRRVEILADVDKRPRARRLAREYARKGLQAFVVNVPDNLGDKADLNDLLMRSGLEAVRAAVEDAERISPAGKKPVSDLDLRIGSDVEIGKRSLELLEDIYGPMVYTDGAFWTYDKTHYTMMDSPRLVRFIHRADGVGYVDARGKLEVVKLTSPRVQSIIVAMSQYRHQADFFAQAPVGINCETGFIQIGADGVPTLLPHGPRWRQRHIVRGRWPVDNIEERRDSSLLAKYLRDAAGPSKHADDEARQRAIADAPNKIALFGEILGASATGSATRLRQPKAIILFSLEPNTGKSRLLMLAKAHPNPEAVASVPPSKFGDEKYTFRLIGKVLNASDELPDRAVRSDVFKRLITGEAVPARDLYRSATDFIPVALHLFSTNKLPSFSGGIDGGVLRRLLPVHFEHELDKREIDPDLVEKIIRDEADLLLDFALDGACRLIKQRDFTIPASSQELLQKWIREADPVRGWAAERIEVCLEGNLIAMSTLYADFKEWAHREGIREDHLPSGNNFGLRLRTAEPRLRFTRSNMVRQCRNAKFRDPNYE